MQTALASKVARFAADQDSYLGAQALAKEAARKFDIEDIAKAYGVLFSTPPKA